MPLPKLSPLQSRFAASLTASFILLLIYLSLTRPHFAYAVELDSRIPLDHNHPIVFDVDFDEEEVVMGVVVAEVEPQKRQTATALSLSNNEPQNKNINFGETQAWVFTEAQINGPAGEQGRGLPIDDAATSQDTIVKAELRKRQSSKQVYISVNTCLQPESTSGSNNPIDLIPPPLILYYVQSSTLQSPGPSSTADQQNITVDGGYALVNITAGSDVYVGIAAVNATGFTGSWNYEIAASIDAPFHSVEETTPYLHFIDSDNHASLLLTDNFTQALPNSSVYQQWMNMAPPYGLMGHNQNDPSIFGISKSYCGLLHNAQMTVNINGVTNQNVASLTTRGLGAKPKEQFYVTFLNASSSYWASLVMQGNSTNSGLGVVGGGGKVWMPVNFSTKAEPNCALMYNLTFCSEVAYAVPSNPDLFSPRGGLPELAQLYDQNAQTLYQNFNYSLQQIPCNTTASAQYSLARNCDDCARAYKQWLCAVTIPRCEDFTNPASYLKPRNVAQPFPNGTMLNPALIGPDWTNLVATNQSRNPLIDAEIKPGPYKEVLPCDDLCYDLVQSCPAALGFGCPYRRAGLEDSYGFRSSNGGEITCSYLGAAYYLSAATRFTFLIGLKTMLLVALGLGLLMAT